MSTPESSLKSTPKPQYSSLKKTTRDKRSEEAVTPTSSTKTPNKTKMTTNGRSSRRLASSKTKSNFYKESPEILDISSDGAGSDNYNAVEESSSDDNSELDESVELENTIGNGKSKKSCSSKSNQKSKATKKLSNQMATPSSKNTPSKRKVMTPRIPCRTIPLPNVVSPLQEAQMRLHVAAVPQCLPCREEEFYEILAFTEGKIVDGTGGCMYISGLPGTGKTATVREVIRTLKEQADVKDIPEFEFIEINGK